MVNQGRAGAAWGDLSGAETAQLSRQIAGLAQAGLPLGAGLMALSLELPRGALKRSMSTLAETLEAGVPLEQALDRDRGRVAPHLRGLVLAGLRTGNLGDLLSRFSTYFGVGTEIKRRLWLNLAYPIVTAIGAFSLFVFISTVLVGQFESIIRDFGVPAPILTVAVISAARVLRIAWVPLMVVAVALALVFVVCRLFVKPPVRRSLAARLPLIGSVWRSTSQAEFCHLLALLLESHLTLPEALELTGEGVEDADVDRLCRHLAADVKSGKSLGESMRSSTLFPKGLARLLHWADGDRSMPEVLHMAGSMFEARARSNSTLAGTVASVLCVFMILGIIMIIPALFLPLISVISRLSG